MVSVPARPDEALQEYATALDFEPTNHEVLSGLCQVLGSLDRDEESIQLLENALQLAPDDLTIIAEIALQFWRTKRLNEALELGREQ